jgi:hypothetical protein
LLFKTQQFRKIVWAGHVSVVLVVYVSGFMAIWPFCRTMEHLLMGNFGSFRKFGRAGAFSVAREATISLR